LVQHRSVLIVVNPASGRSGFRGPLSYLLDRLHAAGIHARVFVTQKEGGRGLLHSFLKRRGPFGDVAVIGGDGTLNYAVNELYGTGIPMSVLGNGRGNDSVKSLHGVTVLAQQVDILIEGRVHHFDLGRCNDRLFINGVGVGFDGKVVEFMLRSKKVLGGHLAYLATVLRLLGWYREEQVDFTLDGKNNSRRVFMMTVSNGTTFGGGFVINPRARTDDGYLDLCLIREISVLKRFRYLPLLRTGAHTVLPEVELSRLKEISIPESRQIVAHLDGEFIGHPPYHIRVVPAALPFRVPPAHGAQDLPLL
jgi:diacylglycerol kinase (ATP)